MKKPEKLYHASHDTNIVEFEPRNESPRYIGEVDLVFATPHPGIAAMFLAPKDIPIEISVYGDKYVAFINSNEQEYALKDKGGAIYTLPVDTFETDQKNGMGEAEWVSKVPVKPITTIIFKSSLEAMHSYGVEKHFVSDAVFEEIRKDPGNALGLVS
jgi:hypothetical protein